MYRRPMLLLALAIGLAAPAVSNADEHPPRMQDVRRSLPAPDDLRAHGLPLPETPVDAPECGIAVRGACPEGTFALHEGWIGERSPLLDLRHEEIRLQRGQISTATGCGPAPAKVRVTEDGYRVSAMLPDCSEGGDVLITGHIDIATASTFIGKISKGVLGELPAIATKGLGDAVRLGTYNTQFLPSTFFEKVPEDAAEKIAERIKASRYDVIALNEVFDEDAKENSDPNLPGFIDEMSSTYPYYVQYLTGDFSTTHEDSGLMLFSRFPFEDLPKTTYQMLGGPVGNCVAWPTCSQVAFYEFDSCDDDDCLAEKGAGFVRVRNPQTGNILNVAFTHMQAPYFDDDGDDMVATFNTRSEQLGEIKRLIEETLHQHQIDSEEIYVIGDLNIDGDLANPDWGDPRPNENPADFAHNRFEWELHFGQNASSHGGWFHDRLRDTIFDTSPADRMITNRHHFLPHFAPGDARLDYILRSTGNVVADRTLCVQHLTLAHNLRWGAPAVESGLGQPGTEAGATELSDHLGVTADLGPQAPHCSAAKAKQLAIAEGDTAFENGTIQYPGGMQWFRIDEPGTYGFWLNHGNVKHHVYDDEDLSMPLANYKDLSKTILIDRVPFTFEMFLVPEAPFYIRVFNPTYSGWTGNYTLGVHRFSCTSKEEACLLAPGQTLEGAFKENIFVGNDDAFWYEIHSEAPGWKLPGQAAVKSGVAQLLEFELDRLPSTVGVADATLQLRDITGTSILGEDLIPKADLAEPDYGSNPTKFLALHRAESDAKGYLLRVGRDHPQTAFPFRIGWRTDLTVLHGSQVGIPNAPSFDFVVADHGDAVGDEEFYFWLEADGHMIVAEKHLGDFTEPSNRVLEQYVTWVGYVSSVRASFWEVDNAYDDPPSPDAGHIDDDDLVQATIGPLQGPCKTAETVHMVDDEGYGAYWFTYNRCYGLPI